MTVRVQKVQSPKNSEGDSEIYKNYKKVPGIKGQDHVTTSLRQGKHPMF